MNTYSAADAVQNLKLSAEFLSPPPLQRFYFLFWKQKQVNRHSDFASSRSSTLDSVSGNLPQWQVCKQQVQNNGWLLALFYQQWLHGFHDVVTQTETKEVSGEIRLQDALMVIDNVSITATGKAWINGCNILALRLGCLISDACNANLHPSWCDEESR